MCPSFVYAVTRLGGLYVWLNFLNILWQHMTHSGRKFNHVDLDHNQEWLNGTGKKGGDIVGKIGITTNTANAQCRGR